mgnify:CR=1 FL=1|tara:strand:+ start:4224 stop:4451 length:228 start_codon:yes stop_codon:yes gene_type:complete
MQININVDKEDGVFEDFPQNDDYAGVVLRNLTIFFENHSLRNCEEQKIVTSDGNEYNSFSCSHSFGCGVISFLPY